MRGSPSALVALASLAIASPVRAEAARLVALDYVAPDQCPNGASFRDRVEARTKGAVFVLGAVREAKTSARVRVTADADGSHAKVQVPGAAAERTLDGDTCNEVVDASALLVAMAVEASTLDEAVEAADRPVAPPSPATRRAELVLLAHGGITTATGPEIAPAAKIGVGVRDGGRGVAPEGRIEGRFASGGDATLGDASASFRSFGVAASACPVALGPGPLRLAPCAALALGALSAAASGFADAKTESRLWLAAEVGARFGLALGAAAFVELEGWAVMPLVRERFAFGSALVHETAPVGAAASLGAGVHFP